MEMTSILNAAALIPRFDENGKPYTIVVKNNHTEKVHLKAPVILDKQLHQIGSSLKGAKEAAKAMLGTTSMHPVITQARPIPNIWFPSESTRNDTCMYFALHQIVKMEPYLIDNTIVYLAGKYAVTVPVPRSKFVLRYNQALIYFAMTFLKQLLDAPYCSLKEAREILRCAELNEAYITQ